MIRNYLLVASRVVARNPVYYAINVLGLTIGITCCLLILSYVRFELGFDSFHTKKDRIFRLNYNYAVGDQNAYSPSVPVFVAPFVKKLFPEVEQATRFTREWTARTVRHGENMFDEKNFCWADSTFFQVFDFKGLAGDLKKALSKPGTVVITASTAKKYFGDADPLGQVLLSNNSREYEVSAVIEDVPPNSHLTFDFLTSIYSRKSLGEDKIDWNNPQFTTFLLLAPGADWKALEEKIDRWVNPSESKTSASLHLPMEPLAEVHFNTMTSNYQNQLAVTDPKYLVIFSVVAGLILLIASVNYINLSTARAATRAREIGMRKTAGATFNQLVVQFLSESFFFIFPSILLSLILAVLFMPVLNGLLGKSIPFEPFTLEGVGAIMFLWLILSLLAGLYPSLVLARFKPITVLRGKYAQSSSGLAMRKGLVILQFAISTVLVASTLIILAQLDFMQSKVLGIDKDQIVLINGNTELNPKLESFAEELRRLPAVEDVTRTFRSPFETAVGNGFTMDLNSNDHWDLVGVVAADDHYLNTMGISLLEGRNFDPLKIHADSTINEFIVNETFLDHFGLTQKEALGKQAILGSTFRNGPGTIVGVMKDFHVSSLQEKVGPILLSNHPDFFIGILVRIKPADMKESLGQIEKVWKSSSPQRPFNYKFLDEQYDAMYRTEERTGALILFFSGLAIFVACLGLMGLASFTSRQRAKEISIRKVLGASAESIVALLGVSYLKLIVISFAVALPFSYFTLSTWLEGFAYRVEITPFYFLVSFTTVLAVAGFTVVYQSYAASVANPAQSLRLE